MVIFIELVQYAKNLGGKSRKNLVEHQIIKMMLAQTHVGNVQLAEYLDIAITENNKCR